MNNSMQHPVPVGRSRALCCQCGNLRTVAHTRAAGYRPKDFIAEPRGLGSHWHADRYAGDDVAHWRLIGRLKCSNCRQITPHAILRDNDPCRDHIETQNGRAVLSEEDSRSLLERDLQELRDVGVRAFLTELGDKRYAAIVTQSLDDGVYAIEVNTSCPPDNARDLLNRILPSIIGDSPFQRPSIRWYVRPGRNGKPPMREAFYGYTPARHG